VDFVRFIRDAAKSKMNIGNLNKYLNIILLNISSINVPRLVIPLMSVFYDDAR
jgi:hypothetical protein